MSIFTFQTKTKPYTTSSNWTEADRAAAIARFDAEDRENVLRVALQTVGTYDVMAEIRAHAQQARDDLERCPIMMEIRAHARQARADLGLPLTPTRSLSAD
jgi:hypothetical protein